MPARAAGRPPGPLDLGLVLGPLRRGPADPTFRIDPGRLRLARQPHARRAPAPSGSRGAPAARVEAEAWGPGADWLLDQLPALLGADDDPAAFTPRHRLVAAAHRRRPGLRLTRTGLVLESLIPSILEQKVTTRRGLPRLAAARTAVRRARPRPGTTRLYVMPDARTWALIPSWEWHRAGVDAKRSATDPARRPRRPPPGGGRGHGARTRPHDRLELIPGIGPWTSAETLQRSNGAPDAVTVGDLHLPGIVGYALAGDRDADDAAMLELLAPYAGQRHRAARLILLSGRAPPRREPTMPAATSRALSGRRNVPASRRERPGGRRASAVSAPR